MGRAESRRNSQETGNWGFLSRNGELQLLQRLLALHRDQGFSLGFSIDRERERERESERETLYGETDNRRHKVQNSKVEDREMLLPGLVLLFPGKLQGVH